MTEQPSVSVAIPVYNEEAVVPELLRRTRAVLDAIPGGPHQIVVVDDGSSDRTWELLETAAEEDSRLVVIALSRNFGHQTALGAALNYVSGDVTVVMDGDLQDPPEAIPILLDSYRQGYDVVYVQRVNRKEAWWLRACYYLFYRLLAALSSIQLPTRCRRFRTHVTPRSSRNQGDAGAPSLPSWNENVGRIPPGWRSDRTRSTPCGPYEIQPAEIAQAGIGWDFCFFHRPTSRCGNIRSRRHRVVASVFHLLALREVLVARAAGFHCVNTGDHVPFWRKPVLLGDHRRVHRSRVRRGEGASALRSSQGGRATQSWQPCGKPVHGGSRGVGPAVTRTGSQGVLRRGCADGAKAALFAADTRAWSRILGPGR